MERAELRSDSSVTHPGRRNCCARNWGPVAGRDGRGFGAAEIKRGDAADEGCRDGRMVLRSLGVVGLVVNARVQRRVNALNTESSQPRALSRHAGPHARRLAGAALRIRRLTQRAHVRTSSSSSTPRCWHSPPSKPRAKTARPRSSATACASGTSSTGTRSSLALVSRTRRVPAAYEPLDARKAYVYIDKTWARVPRGVPGARRPHGRGSPQRWHRAASSARHGAVDG